MPITKSAKKALRQSLKRRTRNLIYKKRIKKIKKEFENLIAEKRLQEAEKLIPQIYQTIDKAAKKKVIKKETASRKKSKILKIFNKIKKLEK